MSSRSITAAARVTLLVAVGAILVIATSERPLPMLESVSDKIQHALAFAALSLLADRSFPESRFGVAKAASLLAFGIAIEAIQSFVPWREASWPDVAADGAGIALYALSAPLVAKYALSRRHGKG